MQERRNRAEGLVVQASGMFQEENEDSEVQALYYEFFEHKRRALVKKAVRKTQEGTHEGGDGKL